MTETKINGPALEIAWPASRRAPVSRHPAEVAFRRGRPAGVPAGQSATGDRAPPSHSGRRRAAAIPHVRSSVPRTARRIAVAALRSRNARAIAGLDYFDRSPLAAHASSRPSSDTRPRSTIASRSGAARRTTNPSPRSHCTPSRAERTSRNVSPRSRGPRPSLSCLASIFGASCVIGVKRGHHKRKGPVPWRRPGLRAGEGSSSEHACPPARPVARRVVCRDLLHSVAVGHVVRPPSGNGRASPASREAAERRKERSRTFRRSADSTRRNRRSVGFASAAFRPRAGRRPCASHASSTARRLASGTGPAGRWRRAS
jgi:hypothetical protein